MFLTWDTEAFIHSPTGKIAAAALLVIAVGWIALSLLSLKKEQCIVFDNPDGEVIISIKAIEDFISRLAKTFTEIKEVSPSITPMNDGVDVDLKLVLWDDENVHVIVDKMKSVMRDQIQNFFGVANIHSIKIYVTRTVPREKYVEKNTSTPEPNK